MNEMNCPECKGTRTLLKDRNETSYRCKQCGEQFSISMRVKRLFPDIDTRKILKEYNRYRTKKVYESTKSIVSCPERENLRDMTQGKLIRFRDGDWSFSVEPYEYTRGGIITKKEQCIWFSARLKTEDDTKKIKVPTDMSIEEYKLYQYGDKKNKKQIHISGVYPYNLHISLLRKIKRSETSEIKYKIFIGTDLNFPIVVSAINIDKIQDSEKFFVKTPFPENRIRRLHERKNKYHSEGNLQGSSNLQNISSKITKGSYYLHVGNVFSKIKKQLKIKNLKNVKIIWYIEDTIVLRKLHSQFTAQGWKPTVFKECLDNKSRNFFIEVKEVNPAYTSITCNKCRKRNARRGEKMKCECGEARDWHENAAINILHGGVHKLS